MIDINIHTQPNDETCGQTCLKAIYDFYGVINPLDNLIKEVARSNSGGTLAPMLGEHALQHDFDVTIYINNLDLFDPSWFRIDPPPRELLITKLRTQMHYKDNIDFVQASNAYIRFLELGGILRLHIIDIPLLKKYFIRNTPILAGLSATYLYHSVRELYSEEGISVYDDIRGTPCGHFVILCGYDTKHRHIIVADPQKENPLSHDNYYKVSSHRLINAILLGTLTYDANLMVIEPKGIINANYSGH